MPEFSTGNASTPVSNETFYLWSRDSGCYTNDYEVNPRTQVEIVNDEISVFFQAGLGGNTICVSPPPPIYLQRVTFDGLDVGNYTLNIYDLPYGDEFPPVSVNYPNYFVTRLQFDVIGGIANPVVVDSTTNIGLAILVLLTLMTGLHFNRRRKFLNKLN